MSTRPSAIATYDRAADVFVLRAARELKSPNSWLGAHWGAKGSERTERQAWTGTLGNAVGNVRGLDLTQIRRCVSVERIVPAKRNLIRDDDNLVGALKPLLDALVRLEYIKDDRREWCEVERPTQTVGTDHAFWTVITIAPATAAAAVDLAELRRQVKALEGCDWDQAEMFAGEDLVSRDDVLKILGEGTR